MKIIDVKNIEYEVEDKKILKDVSFSIEEGQYTSILGMNGSGKSTLALALANLIKIDKGTIKIKDNLKVGLILEEPDNQIIGTTVEEDIIFGLQNLQMSRNEMENILCKTLKELNIENLRYREITTLSGGQKQKVAFATLMAMDYQIYILDEVTSMLDPESRKIVYNLIDELLSKNKTILQITHFMDEASLSKQSIVINDGKIIYDGLTKELMKDNKLLVENNLKEEW